MYIALLTLLITIGLFCYWYFAIIEICGDSMYPTLKNGEYYLATRVASPVDFKVGEIYCFIRPEDPNRMIVKRIVNSTEDKSLIFVRGDNTKEGASYDSRHYGYINSECLKYKLLKWRIA